MGLGFRFPDETVDGSGVSLNFLGQGKMGDLVKQIRIAAVGVSVGM